MPYTQSVRHEYNILNSTQQIIPSSSTSAIFLVIFIAFCTKYSSTY